MVILSLVFLLLNCMAYKSNPTWSETAMLITFMRRPLRACIFWNSWRKCSLNIGDMLHFYTTVIICPVYSTPAQWGTQVLRMNNVFVLNQFINVLSILWMVKLKTILHSVSIITCHLLCERLCELSKRFFQQHFTTFGQLYALLVAWSSYYC